MIIADIIYAYGAAKTLQSVILQLMRFAGYIIKFFIGSKTFTVLCVCVCLGGWMGVCVCEGGQTWKLDPHKTMAKLCETDLGYSKEVCVSSVFEDCYAPVVSRYC